MQFKLRFPVWIQSINSFYFDLLFQVVEVILAIPYSNAADENIFTMISKNKTSSVLKRDILKKIKRDKKIKYQVLITIKQ